MNLPHPDFALAFDIDGVIRFGKTVIADGVPDMLRKLREPPEGEAPIPYVFITNSHGTGKGMSDELGKQLGYNIDPNDLITGVTPLPEVMPETLFHEPVLIVSNDYVYHQVCELFKFDKPYWVEDLVKKIPGIVPHRDWSKTYRDDIEPIHVSSILLCNEPGCLHTSLQICLDALLQGGDLTPKINKELKPDQSTNEMQIPKQLPVFSVNPDFWYSSSYPSPRLTLGSMVICLKGLYKEAIRLKYGVDNNQELDVVTIGKPTRPTFIFSKKRLEKISGYSPSRIYMIGDSLSSDILGANNCHDIGYISVLVKSKSMPDGLISKIKPDIIFSNVCEAVDSIIEMEKNNDHPQTKCD